VVAVLHRRTQFICMYGTASSMMMHPWHVPYLSVYVMRISALSVTSNVRTNQSLPQFVTTHAQLARVMSKLTSHYLAASWQNTRCKIRFLKLVSMFLPSIWFSPLYFLKLSLIGLKFGLC
jgi:hypothetical protein